MTSLLSLQKDQRVRNHIDSIKTVTPAECNLSRGFGEVICGEHSPRLSGVRAGRGVPMDGRPPAIFVGDALGLDFLNSIATPVDTAIDWIEDGSGYLSWLEQARLVSGDVLRDLKTRALPGELDKIADQARSLREWFIGFVRQHNGSPLAAKALADLEP